MSSEHVRLQDAARGVPWRKWGPYLSERQWGTVREDYSQHGGAWDYFTHEQSRSRAYRRGEDGLAGFSDDNSLLCFALALWNGRDPILKERLFGLTNSEGNHGEDVKEQYYYLDATPTHSYMRYLYKYPQAAFPYRDLVETNRARSRTQPEYELFDTGVFDGDSYFDVFVEYAKASPEDLLIQITVHNRGDAPASLHVLPSLWFRNTWSGANTGNGHNRPTLNADREASATIKATHAALGNWSLRCHGSPTLLFTDNETNNERVFGTPNTSRFVKDGIGLHVVEGRADTINPAQTGTKAAAQYVLQLPARGSESIRLRLSRTDVGSVAAKPFGVQFDALFRDRKRECDEFYADVIAPNLDADRVNIVRQALAGMLWSKQHYDFNVQEYLSERGVDPLRPDATVRNREWFHMVNNDVISMPDKWEYPWYAAWDLAFHTIALSMVDIDFAKQQLDLVVGSMYLHPNGQIPAYEWNFSDVNPPVHGWAALFLFRQEQAQRGKGDTGFLARIFGKLMVNFTWWVNRKDRFGKNVFEGGFLGLDNIGVFDRSAALPAGGHLEQADGTAWMALYCENMLEMCAELAHDEGVFDHLATKYLDHFIWIARAMNHVGADGMWDEEDGFYYDVLRLPDGSAKRLKVRSLVGILPLCATMVVEPAQRERLPYLVAHFQERMRQLPELRDSMHPLGPEHRGHGDRSCFALVNASRLRRILSRVLDEAEFLSDYGIRSVSRYHRDHPYVFEHAGHEYRVDYQPAESDSGMFGGNSNWRGPIWTPINALIIRSLMTFHLFYGDDFQIECPTGSGQMMNLFEVARELTTRLGRIFTRDPATGQRPVFGGVDKLQQDPEFRDYLLFYEYFHGDNGAGIGASHQTGWTGIVAKLMDLFARLDADTWLAAGNKAAFASSWPPPEAVRIDDSPQRARRV